MFGNLFRKNKALTIEEDWENYISNRDNEYATILVNLAYYDLIPIKEYTTHFSCSINIVEENSILNKHEELKLLFQIEDDVIQALAKKVIYCGFMKTQESFKMFFYCKNNKNYDGLINDVMKAYNYGYTIEEKLDESWKSYTNYLYPNKYDMIKILENRKFEERKAANEWVLDTLKEHGDVESKEREVTHNIKFNTKYKAELFAKEVEALQYRVESITKEEDKFCVTINRIDNVIAENVHKYTWTLVNLADKHDGVYDGWGTSIVQ